MEAGAEEKFTDNGQAACGCRRQHGTGIIFLLIAAVAVFAASVLRVWLITHTGCFLIADAMFDDAGQILTAESLIKAITGGAVWDYWQLIKGISLPLFLAMRKLLNIPYYHALGMFMVVASAVFTWGVSPWVRCWRPLREDTSADGSGHDVSFKTDSIWKTISLKVTSPASVVIHIYIYIFVLFNPIGFSNSVTFRIYRNALIPWTILIVTAFLLRIFHDCGKDGYARLAVKCLGLGAALAFFWYLREDSVWIAPLVAGACILSAVYRKVVYGRKVFVYALILLIPPLMVFAAGKAQEKFNERVYGIETVNIRTDSAFSDVMGLLYRMDEGGHDESVWICEETVTAAMRESRTFAMMQDAVKSYVDAEGVPGGDMWQWTFIKAGRDIGIYADAPTTAGYWGKVNSELQTAIDSGKLPYDHTKIYLSSQARGFAPEELPRFAGDALINTWQLMKYGTVRIDYPVLAAGDAGNIGYEQRVIGVACPATVEEAAVMYPHMALAISVSQRIISIYRLLLPAMVLMSGAGLVFMAAGIIRDGDRVFCTKKLFAALGILASAFELVMMVTMFISWMEGGGALTFYSCGAFALIAAAEILMMDECVLGLRRYLRRKRK